MPESAVSALDEQAIEWLLGSSEPGIRLQTQRDLLGQKIQLDPEEVVAGPLAAALLAGQQPGGGFGVDPYRKWLGGHWRLVSLIELGVPAGEPRTMAALEAELRWLAEDDDPEAALRIQGRYRVHGSVYANPLAVATRLGRANDPRVKSLAEKLALWQWPDGGWNCDRHPNVTHSSFYESITPLWGLTDFARATGDASAAEAAARASEFFLSHRVFKSHSTDTPGDPKWINLRYPEYWHFDYLHGLVMLDRAGALPDPRAAEALQLLRDQQQPDGRWVASGPQYWKGVAGLYGDPAGWTRDSASQMLTLNALRVLRATAA